MKVAKLFKNGQSQAVRLPKEFRCEGTQVFIKRVGNAVLLLPEQNSWQMLFDSLNQFSDDFMEFREQPDQQERLQVLALPDYRAGIVGHPDHLTGGIKCDQGLGSLQFSPHTLPGTGSLPHHSRRIFPELPLGIGLA